MGEVRTGEQEVLNIYISKYLMVVRKCINIRVRLEVLSMVGSHGMNRLPMGTAFLRTKFLSNRSSWCGDNISVAPKMSTIR